MWYDKLFTELEKNKNTEQTNKFLEWRDVYER